MKQLVLLTVILACVALGNGPTGSPPPDATATQRGLVSAGAQQIGGSKAIDGGVSVRPESASAIGLLVYARASQTADLLEVVDSSGNVLFLVSKEGVLTVKGAVTAGGLSPGASFTISSYNGSTMAGCYTASATTTNYHCLYGTGGNTRMSAFGGQDLELQQAAATFWKMGPTGLVSQSGTDSSASPGAATINKPCGISAIASGSSTVVITNSLATTTIAPQLTWLGDHGAARSWVVRAAGSFTVTLSANASANTSFSWCVKGLL